MTTDCLRHWKPLQILGITCACYRGKPDVCGLDICEDKSQGTVSEARTVK